MDCRIVFFCTKAFHGVQKSPYSSEVQRQYFNEFGQHLYKSVAQFAGQICDAGNETVVKTKFSRRRRLIGKEFTHTLTHPVIYLRSDRQPYNYTSDESSDGAS